MDSDRIAMKHQWTKIKSFISICRNDEESLYRKCMFGFLMSLLVILISCSFLVFLIAIPILITKYTPFHPDLKVDICSIDYDKQMINCFGYGLPGFFLLLISSISNYVYFTDKDTIKINPTIFLKILMGTILMAIISWYLIVWMITIWEIFGYYISFLYVTNIGEVSVHFNNTRIICNSINYRTVECRQILGEMFIRIVLIPFIILGLIGLIVLCRVCIGYIKNDIIKTYERANLDVVKIQD